MTFCNLRQQLGFMCRLVRIVAWAAGPLFVACHVAGQESAPRELIVLSDDAPVANGSRIVSHVTLGQQFTILESSPKWHLIEVTTNGVQEQGWIHDSYVRVKDDRNARASLSATERRQLLYQADLLYDGGQRLERTGRYSEAILALEQTREMREDVLGTSNLEYADCLNLLGWCHDCLCDYESAKLLYEQSLAIVEEIAGESHPYYARTLQNLAGLFKSVGDFINAERLILKAVALQKQTLGEWHQDYANGLNSLATYYRSIGDYAKAESLFIQAGDIWRGTLGEAHYNYAYSLINLALLYQEMGEYEKAEPLFLRTRSNWARTLGESHPDFAFCIDHLAKLYTVTGEFENSERLHIQALEIYRNAWGEIHPNCAITIDNLALLHRTMGDHAEAELLHRKALNIWKQTVGESDHDYARCLSSLATVLAEAGQLREAAQCFDESRRISRTHIDRVLPGLSETEQLVFLNVKDHADLHAALSLGLRCADDSEIAEISAGWLLNSKALVQDTMSQQVRLATISQSPEVVKLSADLRAVRSRLARLSLDPSAIENVTSFRSEVENLHQRERELSKAVGRAQGEIFHTEAWIEVDEVLHTLGEDTVFIDIARIQVTNFDSSDESVPSNAHSYVAWLIPAPGRGEIKIVNLGSASEIEAAIQLARAGMNDPQDLILERGEREVENDLVEMLQQLSSMILRPLLDNISDQRHLILSPDSALWLVPWAALPIEGDRYAIEEYDIHYVTSGRDLVANRSPSEHTRSAPLVMADPDFDFDFSQSEDVESTIPAREYLRRSTGKLPRVERLPATAVEAQEIRPSIERYSRETPLVYTGVHALERVFKETTRPKVVTLSTHGFFFKDQEAKVTSSTSIHETRSVALTVAGKPLENPLIRCGVLLAGCNHRDKAGETQDDGVLTGLEIVGTDLRTTDLVVLSACDTGLGDVRHGEGVAGLRHAFLLAGAENIVATLWKIPDLESALLMKGFFDQLAAGKSKSEALRAAQLDRITARRARYGVAHPFYWAAFTLTGKYRG